MTFSRKHGALLTGFALLACDDGAPSESAQTAETSDTGPEGDTTQDGTGGGGAMTGAGGSAVVTPFTPTTGSGGTTAAGPLACSDKGTGSNPLIDDFEDQDKFVLPNEGRGGSWEAFDDSKGTFANKFDLSSGDGEGVDGGYARCVGVEGFTEWGAGISVGLGPNQCMYDASHYAGVCFEAKGEFSAGDHIEFSINTADTLGSPEGGRCDATDDESNCVRFWHYKTRFWSESAETTSASPRLSSKYNTFCFAWDEFKQSEGAPTPLPRNEEEIIQLEWMFRGGLDTGEIDELGEPVPGSTDATLCIDNVRFMPSEDVAMGGSHG